MPIVKESPVNESKKKPVLQAFSPSLPRYSFQDLIVPNKINDDIFDILALRENADLVFGEWGLDQTHKMNKKVAINFYGPPGTGKTMAAHAVASYFEKGIIEVNYADIESKYVGETPKNLTRAFECAKHTDSVLFFDEADAILSKRVTNMNSSTDTSVNQTRSVMLMLLNDFDGIVVFATNFLSNFDSAFMRRILGHVYFDLPDFETRERLWRHLMPEKMPNDLDIKYISEKYDGISGSDISNAILRSAFKAARNTLKLVPTIYFEEVLESILSSKSVNDSLSVKKRFVSEEYVNSQLK